MEKSAGDTLVSRYFHLAVDKRPPEELYDIKSDPGCLNDLSNNPAYLKTKTTLKGKLKAYLKNTGDPRVLGKGEVFETYPRTEGILRDFPPPGEGKVSQ